MGATKTVEREPVLTPDTSIEDLSESTVKRPQQPVRAFAALRAKLGVTDEQMAAMASAPRSEGEEFVSHAEFEADRYEHPTDCEGMLRWEDQSGQVWQATCDVCAFGVGVPARLLDPNVRAGRLLERSGLPRRFLDRPYDKGNSSAEFTRRWLWSWLKGERLAPAPALFGLPGRGKTHLLVMVCRELIVRRQVPLMFRTAPQLLGELQAAMGTPGYDRVWQQAVTVDLLVLDDLGAEMDTDWRADRVAALVDERYRLDLPLAVTTNIAPDRWGDAFDARTDSRLREMTFALELCGDDRRVSSGDQLSLQATGEV